MLRAWDAECRLSANKGGLTCEASGGSLSVPHTLCWSHLCDNLNGDSIISAQLELRNQP